MRRFVEGEEMGFGGDGDGGEGEGEVKKGPVGPCRLGARGRLPNRHGSGLPGFRGGGDFYGDCLEREREWVLWLKIPPGGGTSE